MENGVIIGDAISARIVDGATEVGTAVTRFSHLQPPQIFGILLGGMSGFSDLQLMNKNQPCRSNFDII